MPDLNAPVIVRKKKPYLTIIERMARLDASTAGTRYYCVSSIGPVAASASAGIGVFYFDPAFYTAAGYTTMRTRVVTLVNATTPVSDFTTSLNPVTAVAGGAAVVTITAGAAVTGSSTLVSAPVANSMAHAESADFAIPAAGYYVLQMVNSANMVANSSLVSNVFLELR